VLSASLYQRFTSRGEDDSPGRFFPRCASSLAGTSKRNQATKRLRHAAANSPWENRMSTLHSNEVPQKASPCVMVIFGPAVTDQTKTPSRSRDLAQEGLLSHQFAIIGFSLTK